MQSSTFGSVPEYMVVRVNFGFRERASSDCLFNPGIRARELRLRELIGCDFAILAPAFDLVADCIAGWCEAKINIDLRATANCHSGADANGAVERGARVHQVINEARLHRAWHNQRAAFDQ